VCDRANYVRYILTIVSYILLIKEIFNLQNKTNKGSNVCINKMIHRSITYFL